MSSMSRKSSVPVAAPSPDGELPATDMESETGADGSIDLNLDEIRKRAYTLSQAKRSYDEFVWMWAEQEARLGKALIVPFGPNVRKIVVDPEKVTTKPRDSEIRRLAADLAKRKVKVQDIHWFIAERQYVADKVLGN